MQSHLVPAGTGVQGAQRWARWEASGTWQVAADAPCSTTQHGKHRQHYVVRQAAGREKQDVPPSRQPQPHQLRCAMSLSVRG